MENFTGDDNNYFCTEQCCILKQLLPCKSKSSVNYCQLYKYEHMSFCHTVKVMYIFRWPYVHFQMLDEETSSFLAAEL